MRYIISSQPLSFLLQFEIPKKDKYGNLDTETFYNSRQGKEFLKINPLVLRSVKEKKDLSFQIAMDISWISLCYNCPLYIYIMTDNWFYNNIPFRFFRYSNYGKSAELQKLGQFYGGYNFPEIQDLRVDINTTYFNGDMSSIDEHFSKIVKENINLRDFPIWGYSLTVEEGFKKIV